MDGPLAFSIVAQFGSTVEVALCGDVDYTTAPALRDAIEALFNTGVMSIVIDASGVTFADTRLLDVLGSFGPERSVTIVRPSEPVELLLDVAERARLT